MTRQLQGSRKALLDGVVVDVVVVPGDGDFVHHQAALVFELRRASVGASDGLAVPAALDFVHKGGVVHGDGLAVRNLCGTGGKEKKETNYGNRRLHWVSRYSIEWR